MRGVHNHGLRWRTVVVHCQVEAASLMGSCNETHSTSIILVIHNMLMYNIVNYNIYIIMQSYMYIALLHYNEYALQV